MLKRYLLGLLFFTMPAFGYFGAIAYSPSTGAYGYAYNGVTRWQAESAAVSYCGVFDCRSAVWVNNGCASLAVGFTGFGYQIGFNSGAVINGALLNCNALSAGCRAVAYVCTPGYF